MYKTTNATHNHANLLQQNVPWDVEFQWPCFQTPLEAGCQGHEPSAAAHRYNPSEWDGQTAALGLLLSDEQTTMILKPCAANTQRMH